VGTANKRNVFMQRKIGENSTENHMILCINLLCHEKGTEDPAEVFLLIQRQYLFASFKGKHNKQAKTKFAHT
jgi:hypothetical protein